MIRDLISKFKSNSITNIRFIIKYSDGTLKGEEFTADMLASRQSLINSFKSLSELISSTSKDLGSNVASIQSITNYDPFTISDISVSDILNLTSKARIRNTTTRRPVHHTHANSNAVA